MPAIPETGWAGQPFTPPKDADGNVDWGKLAEQKAQRDAMSDLHWNADEKRAHEEQRAKMVENLRAAEEAALEKERVKRGLGTSVPQPLASPDSITLEIAMANDTATVRLSYLVDPYLPRACVVGFYGRGGSAKSSFVASLAAQISEDYSTLWVSVEEPADWVKVRHIRSGGLAGTLAVVKAVASKTDAQGRVIASSFNVYEHLEPAILRAKADFDQIYMPPRPLRLVVLDTAVGLTTWISCSTSASIGLGRAGSTISSRLRSSTPVMGSTLIWHGWLRWKACAFASAVS
jgi:hypothetical protein